MGEYYNKKNICTFAFCFSGIFYDGISLVGCGNKDTDKSSSTNQTVSTSAPVSTSASDPTSVTSAVADSTSASKKTETSTTPKSTEKKDDEKTSTTSSANNTSSKAKPSNKDEEVFKQDDIMVIFYSGTWNSSNGSKYIFYVGELGGKRMNPDGETGLPFAYEYVKNKNYTFHFGGMQNNTGVKAEFISDSEVKLIWENGTEETLTHISFDIEE